MAHIQFIDENFADFYSSAPVEQVKRLMQREFDAF